MLPLIKVLMSAGLILAASEAAKRNLALAALLCGSRRPTPPASPR